MSAASWDVDLFWSVKPLLAVIGSRNADKVKTWAREMCPNIKGLLPGEGLDLFRRGGWLLRERARH